MFGGPPDPWPFYAVVCVVALSVPLMYISSYSSLLDYPLLDKPAFTATWMVIECHICKLMGFQYVDVCRLVMQ